jgi:hypothetical protein
MAIDGPAAGLSEMLIGVAVDLARGDDRALPLTWRRSRATPRPTAARPICSRRCSSSGRGSRAWRSPCSRACPATTRSPRMRSTSARLLLAEKARARSARAGAPQALARSAGAARTGAEARAGQPLLLNFLGYGKLERGEDLDAAEAMIRKASALRPTMPRSPIRSAGRCTSAAGCPRRSRRCSARHRRPRPGRDPRASRRCLLQSGRRYEARFAWKRGAGHRRGRGSNARVKAKMAPA